MSEVRLQRARAALGVHAPGLSEQIGRRIGTFLRELHSIDPAAFGGAIQREDSDPAEYLHDLRGPAHLVAVLEANVPPPADQHVVVHADLCAEHLLAAGNQLTGVIDWSDAAVSDPALDCARLYRDFGRAFLSSVLDAYGGLDDPDRTVRRVQFYARCAALEDLAYGLTTGHRHYARAAEASISRLFGTDAEELLDG